MGTPKHSIGTRDDVLIDTPEEADVQPSTGKRRLQRMAGSQTNCEALKQSLEGTDKAKGKKIKNDGDHHIGAANNGGDENHRIGGEGEAKDAWTKEEEKLLQYGFQRTLLKKHGVTKTHINNLAKVINEYPGLGGAMDFISTKGRGNVQEIAKAIRAVPMFGS
jgi:hypothetical protein